MVDNVNDLCIVIGFNKLLPTVLLDVMNTRTRKTFSTTFNLVKKFIKYDEIWSDVCQR